MKPAAVVYLIRNTVNGKAYIGVTSQRPSKRWAVHRRAAAGKGRGYLLHSAMRKHGVEAFTFEVIASARSYADALWTETVLILQHKSRSSGDGEWGYNVTTGGEGTRGWRVSAELKAQTSARFKGVPKTEEHKAAMRGLKRSEEGKSNMRGRRHTPEAIARMKLRKWSPETRAARTGKPRTEATKAKLRKAAAAGLLGAGAAAKRKAVVTPDGSFPSLTAAALAAGISVVGVHRRLSRATPGWSYAA